MGDPLYLLLLGHALSSAGAFFVDTEQPIIFRKSDRSFGYQVVQLDKWVIVSAPLHPEAPNTTGQLYRCDPETNGCTPIMINGSMDNINISLGLSLAVQENPSQLLACGPTMQRSCRGNIYVNGLCYHLDNHFRLLETLPKSLPECNVRSLDIVFLIDGSYSIEDEEFPLILSFVSSVIAAFNGTATQFALVQYSDNPRTEFDFKTFSEVRNHEQLLSRIERHKGGTRTFTAIKENLFHAKSGNRAEAQKVLIVITDGESYMENTGMSESIVKAEEQGVRRFAIGVGKDFKRESAREELLKIASEKPEDHVFNVTDFSALSNFQKELQEKIFTIEGTRSLNRSSFQMEMSQEGFSAILTPDGPILGAVGAYGWSGGAYIYRTGQQNGTWINATRNQTDMRDSYLGYAVQQVEGDLVAVGAPRYQHVGSVFIYRRDTSSSLWSRAAEVRGDKIGSYFGSVLNMVHVNSSQFLLLVGAPTYYSPEAPGGQVYLCPIIKIRNETIVTFTCPRTLQGDNSQSVGHFGSAISVLPDLTGDQFPELAVGAPCEDNNQGALYIFPGQSGGFRTSYIQRIAGRQVSKEIMFFGRSIAGNLDMTQDDLPDLVVGGEGQVLILRSRPVWKVSVSMSFDPSEIHLKFYECTDHRRKGIVTTITVCFTNHMKNIGISERANFTLHSVSFSYALWLDAGRTNPRAVFTNAGSSINTTLTNGAICQSHSIHLPECVDDSLSPLRVALNFSLIGKAVLSEDSRTNHFAEIPFEKNCGVDGVCDDDLRVNLTFTGLTQLVVGTSLDVNLTVSVTNQGDDSYNTRVLIPFPSGLSYRRVSLVENNKRVTVSCSTLESHEVVNCAVNNPLLRPNITVIFMVSFHVAHTIDLGDTLTMVANVTSDNGGFSNDRMTSLSRIRVLYAIYVTITSLEESSKYQNFSSHDTRVQHIYKVINLGDRRVPISVIFLVPVSLGETVIWEKTDITSSQPELSTCRVSGQTLGSGNNWELRGRSPTLNCSVGTCLRTVCNISHLEVQTSVTFTISGSVTKDWTTQTEHENIYLQSSAEIVYDSQTYQHLLEQRQRFTTAQAQTLLELYMEYNYYPVIIGSSVGGLVLLGLIAAGLYKIGFFKRQYKELLENPEEQSAGNVDTAEEPQKDGAPE
ncbi:integrin alpha-M-like isoform X2 [Mixophyes fleayi]|uniref:integrin alpha-M-like isoform X2 n=1 Tax=Mixophyes fleayi TaxID=3061075 RepID=UPI003F4D8C98